jgi:hypothetical protein
MAEQKASRAPRKKDQKDPDAQRERDSESNGGEEAAAVDEKELASYLQERIKPGLNRGSIPLLARSIAREIARDDYHREEPEEDEDEGEDQDGEGEDAADLEEDLHTLQQRLGDDWTLFYAVHGGDAWLIAETQDVTQRVEAPNAKVLVKAVEVLTQGGGRSGAPRSRSKED